MSKLANVLMLALSVAGWLSPAHAAPAIEGSSDTPATQSLPSQASPARHPRDRPADAPTLQPWQTLGALAYVGVLAAAAFFGVRYLKRRRSIGGPLGASQDGIHLQSSRRIGLTSAIHVLEIKGKTVVMATHGNSVDLLQIREGDGG